MIKIQIISTPDKETDQHYHFHKSEVKIGRSNNCDLIIYDPLLDNKHLDIAFIENILVAKPSKPHLQYYLNGKKCIGARKLVNGDIIAAGKSVIKILESTRCNDMGYKKLAETSLQNLMEKKSDLIELLELLQNEILIAEGNVDA